VAGGPCVTVDEGSGGRWSPCNCRRGGLVAGGPRVTVDVAAWWPVVPVWSALCYSLSATSVALLSLILLLIVLASSFLV